MSGGTPNHYKQLLRLIIYIRNTRNHKLKMIPKKDECNWTFNCFCDSDWAGDENDHKSVSGWLIKLNGCVICWGSRKQNLTSLSSTEAEYIAVSEVAKEILFAKTVLEFIGDKEITFPITINCDSTGAIYLSNNQESRRTKYLDTKVHFIRQYVEDGVIKLNFIKSEENLADTFTKNVNNKSILENYPYLTS